MKKQYLHFILPSTLSFLLSGIYSIVDGIFVGKAMGDMGLAAINIVWPLCALVNALGTGLGMGAAVMYSLKKGAGEEEKASRIEGNALLLLVASSILLLLLLTWSGSFLLTLLGAEGEIHTHAMIYLHYMLYGAVIQAVATGAVPLMRNRGAAYYSMCSMACGCVLNIILDYVLVWVYPLGLKGAAIATVIGQCQTLIFAMAFYPKKENRIPLSSLRPEKEAILSICKVAASPFGLTYLPSITILLMNLQCLRYGQEAAVSAYAVLAYIVSFMELLVQGISDGAQPLLSLSKGKGDTHALSLYTKWTFSLTVLIGFGSSILFYLMRRLIPAFYGTSETAGEMIIESAPAFALVILLYGLTKPSVSYFYATEKLKASNVLVYGEIILTNAAILILPLFLGLNGVWYTMPFVQIVLSVVAVLFHAMYRRQVSTPAK